MCITLQGAQTFAEGAQSQGQQACFAPMAMQQPMLHAGEVEQMLPYARTYAGGQAALAPQGGYFEAGDFAPQPPARQFAPPPSPPSPPAEAESAGTGTSESAQDNHMLDKTKLCKFFPLGRCRRGQACSFAHGAHQLRAKPDLFKTQMCLDLLATGVCDFGENCKYAHGEAELRGAVSAAQIHVPPPPQSQQYYLQHQFQQQQPLQQPQHPRMQQQQQQQRLQQMQHVPQAPMQQMHQVQQAPMPPRGEQRGTRGGARGGRHLASVKQQQAASADTLARELELAKQEAVRLQAQLAGLQVAVGRQWQPSPAGLPGTAVANDASAVGFCSAQPVPQAYDAGWPNAGGADGACFGVAPTGPTVARRNSENSMRSL